MVPLFRRLLLLLSVGCACGLGAVGARAQLPDAADDPTRTSAPAGDVQRYAVVIKAPDDIGVLFYRYLELVRRQYDADIDRDQLELLADRAQRQARTLLNTEGYFAPDVSAEIDFEAQPWRVTLEAKPGDPVIVKQVDLELVGDAKADAETFYRERGLADLFRLKVGDRFRQTDWDAGKAAILRGFLLERFPDARIVFSQARVQPEAHEVTLKVQYDAGPARFFGETRVVGLQRYPETLVRSVNQIAAGSPYQQARLLEMQSELQAFPQFKSVNVIADFDHVVDGKVPVVVEVEENERKRVQIGLGYSTNTRERVQFGYSDYNVFDRGWRFDSLLKLERLEQSLDTSIRLPRGTDGWQDGAGVSLKRTDIEGEVTRTGLVELKRERKDGEFERGVNLRYYYSVQELANSERRIARALAPGVSWTVRHLDDLAYPHRGYVINTQFAVAGRDLGSDETFARAYGKAVLVLPVGEVDALMLRAEGGAVTAKDRTRVPSDLLFRAGGDQSIRGYNYQSIGVEDGGSIVGGRYLAIGGAEYVHWFSKTWGAGVFAETGDAFDQPGNMVLNTGYGFGPRWRSPVGPINFDLAWGERTHAFKFHFSLGIVF